MTYFEDISSSTCALSIFVLPFSSSLSNTARTSIGGFKPNLFARTQRFIRAIPIAGFPGISVSVAFLFSERSHLKTTLLMRMEETYPELRTHIKQPQNLLLYIQPFLVHSRRPTFFLPFLPILLNLCIRHLAGLLFLCTPNRLQGGNFHCRLLGYGGLGRDMAYIGGGGRKRRDGDFVFGILGGKCAG
jgi:hypothetical protein